MSSLRANWMVAARRPRLTHEPTNAWSITAGSVPAMRLSTVLAACAPSGTADWQLIRSGWPDGAAASPAATMRSSSTLVSVSSVSSRPSASVRSPLVAASSGTPKPAVQMVTALGTHCAVGEHDRVRADLRHHVGLEHGDSMFAQPLGDRPPARLGQRWHQLPAAHQRDGVALFGQLGGRLGAGQPGADNGDRGVGMQLVERGAQPLRLLEFRYGISEFGRAGYRRGYRAGAADRVDEVVIVQRGARRQLHFAGSGVDTGGAVDDERARPRRAACRSRPSRRSCLPRVGAAGSARRTSGAG